MHGKGISRILTEIGRETCGEIMMMPPPDQIVEVILRQEQNMALFPITLEVMAETLQWERRFGDLRIGNPNEPAVKTRYRRILHEVWHEEEQEKEPATLLTRIGKIFSPCFG